jgi:hypothetical protein
MEKDEFYQWIEENDTYPEHSHKWMVGLYNKYKGVEAVHRYFGPFETQEKARVWASDYKDKYTKPEFITSIRILPICEVL